MVTNIEMFSLKLKIQRGERTYSEGAARRTVVSRVSKVMKMTKEGFLRLEKLERRYEG